jgi:hypothetical protein
MVVGTYRRSDGSTVEAPWMWQGTSLMLEDFHSQATKRTFLSLTAFFVWASAQKRVSSDITQDEILNNRFVGTT